MLPLGQQQRRENMQNLQQEISKILEKAKEHENLMEELLLALHEPLKASLSQSRFLRYKLEQIKTALDSGEYNLNSQGLKQEISELKSNVQELENKTKGASDDV
jgi:DNA polymerase III gamma/tau subunit